MRLCQGRQPERQTGEVGRHGVAVDPVEAALRDQAARQQFLILIRSDRWARAGMPRPGGDQPRSELPARLHQEGAAAHRGIADLQCQHGLRRGIGADALERGLQRVPHDGFGQAARSVVTASAAALVGGLQQRRAGRRWMPAGRGALVHDGAQRIHQPRHVLRRGERGSDLRRQLAAVGVLLQGLGAVSSLAGGEGGEVEEDRRAVVLAGADRQRGPRQRQHGETHHRLVDAADLLDIEGAIGQALAVQC